MEAAWPSGRYCHPGLGFPGAALRHSYQGQKWLGEGRTVPDHPHPEGNPLQGKGCWRVTSTWPPSGHGAPTSRGLQWQPHHTWLLFRVPPAGPPEWEWARPPQSGVGTPEIPLQDPPTPQSLPVSEGTSAVCAPGKQLALHTCTLPSSWPSADPLLHGEAWFPVTPSYTAGVAITPSFSVKY